MSVQIASGSLNRGGWVGETAGGTKCAVFCASDTSIVAYKNIDGTPSLIGSAQGMITVFGNSAATVGGLHAVMDSADIIHVVAADATDYTGRAVAYATISDPDGTPAWSAWETVFTDYTETGITQPGVAIDIDSNDKPHVLFIDYLKMTGALANNVYYTERTTGSWSSPTQVGVRAYKSDQYYHARICVKGSNDIEAFYYGYTNAGGSDMKARTKTSGSWGSEITIADLPSETHKNLGITVDTSATVRRYHGELYSNHDIYENDVDVGYDRLSLSGGRGVLDSSDNRYIFFIDTSSDIHLISNSGSGWTDEGALQTGTYTVTVIAGWQYRNLNNTTSIDYLFFDGTYVYWDEYALSAGGPVNFSATGSIVTTTPTDASLAIERALSASALVATTTPTDTILAIERALIASALVQTTTPDTVALDLAVFLAASALIQSTTPADAVLAVERAFQAAGLVATVTPDDVVLAITRALSATGSISTTTPADVALAVERLMAAAASIATTTPDDVTLDLAVFFVASALATTTTPDTVSLAIERALTASATITTTTPADVILAVTRAMTAAALVQSTTPDDVVLSLAGIVEFVASALVQSTTPDDASLAVERRLSASALVQTSTPDTVILAVTRALVAAGLVQTVTPDDVVLTLAQVVQFVASALVQTVTPDDASLAIERALQASADIGTTTSTPALAVERALQAAGLIQTTTPDDIKLAVIRALIATALIQTTTPDDVSLAIEQAVGLVAVLFTAARPGVTATGSRPGATFGARRPGVTASGRG